MQAYHQKEIPTLAYHAKKHPHKYTTKKKSPYKHTMQIKPPHWLITKKAAGHTTDSLLHCFPPSVHTNFSFSDWREPIFS